MSTIEEALSAVSNKEKLAKPPRNETEPPDYDMAGYIAKYGVPDQTNGKHLTDEFKLPNHITFSTDSKYSTPETPGGVWDKRGELWHYTPSDFVIKKQTPERLQEYFKKYEPDAVLHLPGQKD
jgi:hypothetical protein